MKKFSVFLALSLAANAAFLVTFFVRPAPASTPSGIPAVVVPAPTAAAPAPGKLTSAQFDALASGDAAQLKAAAIPDEVARQLLVGRAYARLRERTRAASAANPPDDRYWRTRGGPFFSNPQTKAQRSEIAKAQREFSAALRTLDGEPNAPGSTAYDYLPSARREQLLRVEQDYREMQSDIYSDMNGVQLPSDREKLRLLRQEQERDMAAALSPEEYRQYLLHTSQTAQSVMGRYGSAIETEDEYQRIFALQKAFDDQYSPQDGGGAGLTQNAVIDREMASRKLEDDIQAALGPEHFAALQRASDGDYRVLTAVTKRLNLPATTVDTVYAARDSYAALSQQINQDASLSAQDRRAQLKRLADRATADLQATLGAEGAETYAQQSGWLNTLKNGGAFSTNPKDAPGAHVTLGNSIYFLPPPKASPPRG